MPKPIRWAVLIVLLIIAGWFALANRQAVEIFVDPAQDQPPLFRIPLFVAIFFFMVLGVLIGGSAAWLRQAKWRRRAREREREVNGLSRELADARAQQMQSRLPAAPAEARPPD